MGRRRPKRRQQRQALSASEIETLVEGLSAEEMIESTLPIIRAIITDYGQQVLDELQGDGDTRAAVKADDFDIDIGLVKAYLSGYQNQTMPAVLMTTQAELRRALAADTFEQAQAQLRAWLRGQAVNRAAAITQTTTTGAAAVGQSAAAKQSGEDVQREWLSAHTPDTREGHADLDGTRVGVNDVFQLPSGDNAGATAYYPTGFNIPGEDINCYCTVRIVRTAADAGSDEEREALWSAAMEKRAPYDKRLERAVRRSFKLQVEYLQGKL